MKLKSFRGIFAPVKSTKLILCAALAVTLRASGPVVVIVGPPGSGRSTQAEILHKDLGMQVVAADDLIKANPQKFQKNRIPSLQGVDPRLDPAMDDLVRQALVSADLSKGVVLDGFPASKIQGDFLSALATDLGLASFTVIHLAAPDDVVRKRLAGAKGRDIEQEIKDYHREFDFIRDYFPNANIREVDATKPVAEVAKQIRKILQSPAK